MLLLPVKPFYINQKFGENANSYYKQQGMLGHAGIDMSAKHGQGVYASHDGTCYPQIDSHGGNGIVIRSFDTINYQGKDVKYKTNYWHLIDDNAIVHTGQVVKAGDLIAYADNTGLSTGNHLHFQLDPCDDNGYDLFNGNGYGGGIDPTPYLSNQYAQDVTVKQYVFTKVMKLKSWNDDVKELQKLLTVLSLYDGALDGVFGPKTKQGVIGYQTIHGLTPDGIVGKLTLAQLNK